MFIFIMSHLVKYDSVGPLLFENYKKWLECNMITLGAIAENVNLSTQCQTTDRCFVVSRNRGFILNVGSFTLPIFYPLSVYNP